MANKVLKFFSFLLILAVAAACGDDEPNNGGGSNGGGGGKDPQRLYGSYKLFSRVETTENTSKPAEIVKDEIWTFGINDSFTIEKEGKTYTGKYDQSYGQVNITYNIDNGPDDKTTVIIIGVFDYADDKLIILYTQQTQVTKPDEKGEIKTTVTNADYSAEFRKV